MSFLHIIPFSLVDMDTSSYKICKPSLLLGRRDYRDTDFRGRPDRRFSPRRRYSPGRDPRGHRSLHDRRPTSQERGKQIVSLPLVSTIWRDASYSTPSVP